MYGDKTRYEGEWRDGRKHGQGKEKESKLGSVYEGEWFDGRKQGKGCVMTSDKPPLYFRGEWKNNTQISGDIYG